MVMALAHTRPVQVGLGPRALTRFQKTRKLLTWPWPLLPLPCMTRLQRPPLLLHALARFSTPSGLILS